MVWEIDPTESIFFPCLKILKYVGWHLHFLLTIQYLVDDLNKVRD